MISAIKCTTPGTRRRLVYVHLGHISGVVDPDPVSGGVRRINGAPAFGGLVVQDGTGVPRVQTHGRIENIRVSG